MEPKRYCLFWQGTHEILSPTTGNPCKIVFYTGKEPLKYLFYQKTQDKPIVSCVKEPLRYCLLYQGTLEILSPLSRNPWEILSHDKNPWDIASNPQYIFSFAKRPLRFCPSLKEPMRSCQATHDILSLTADTRLHLHGKNKSPIIKADSAIKEGTEARHRHH